MRKERRMRVLLGVVAIPLACTTMRGGDPPLVATRTVDIVGGEYFYQAPDTVAAGLVRIRFRNHGKELHHVQLVRLLQEVPMSEVMRAMDAGEHPAWAEFAGGPSIAGEAGTSEVITDLVPGRYVMLCYATNGQQVRHLMRGMIRPMVVVPAQSPSEGTLPAAEARFTLTDYAFEVAGPLRRGRQLIRVNNAGREHHEVGMVRLAPGVTEAQAAAWLEKPNGPPPVVPVGGSMTIEPGASAVVEVTLEQGTLMLLCFVHTADHRPHHRLGMVKFVPIG